MKVTQINKLTQDHVEKTILVQGALEWKKTNKQDGSFIIKSWVSDATGKIYLPTSFQSDDVSKIIGNLEQKQIVQVKGVVGKVKNSPKEGNFFESINEIKVFEDSYDGDKVIKDLLRDELNKRFKLIKDVNLKKLAGACVESIPNFYKLPFGRDCFDYKGGLADYILRLMDTILLVADRKDLDYLTVETTKYNLDLLLTAAIIHRLGKSNKYYIDDNQRVCETDYGILNDDLSDTLKLYFELLYALKNGYYVSPKTKKKIKIHLDSEIEKQLTHLIETSKGESRWGSMANLKTKEAYLLHYAECIVLSQATFDKYLQNGVKAETFEGGVVRGYHGKEYYLGNIQNLEIEEDEVVENKEETTKDNEETTE